MPATAPLHGFADADDYYARSSSLSFLSRITVPTLCISALDDPFLPPEVIAAGRTPRGHPEGLREAFANIYAEVAQERIARTLGEPAPDFPYPRITEGAHTMAFIEACLASQRTGAWADVAPL